jgi:hypothetical protein
VLWSTDDLIRFPADFGAWQWEKPDERHNAEQDSRSCWTKRCRNGIANSSTADAGRLLALSFLSRNSLKFERRCLAMLNGWSHGGLGDQVRHQARVPSFFFTFSTSTHLCVWPPSID